MVTDKLYKSLLTILTCVLLISCDTFKLETQEEEAKKTVPEEVSIYVPSALNAVDASTNLKTIRGDTIYNYIRIFVNVADEACKIIENSYKRILAIETNNILEFTYTGLDGNTKNVSILENHIENDVLWDYYMKIYNETFSDLALKAYWNEDHHEQRILFKPSSLNKNKMQEHTDALVEIEYKTEDAAFPYEKSMFVAIQGLTVSMEAPFNPDNILLFVGQTGNILDVKGSSNNPNVVLLDKKHDGGRNWAFVAKVDADKNIASAELALPHSWVETNENLMLEYSLKQVLLDEIRTLFPGSYLLSDDDILQLANIDNNKIENPVYFNNKGFVSTGEEPSISYSGLNGFEGITPFVPMFVRDYSVNLFNN